MLTPLRGESMAPARFLMRVPGLIVPENLSFAAIIAPLAVELAPCYWTTCIQSGVPFDGRWIQASSSNARKVESKRFNAATCADDCTCWSPHTFPALAKHVVLDEGSHFWAVRCTDEEAAERLNRIVAKLYDPREKDLVYTADESDVYLMYPDGWWEIYTRHEDWRRKFQAAFQGSFDRSWKRAGECPPL